MNLNDNEKRFVWHCVVGKYSLVTPVLMQTVQELFGDIGPLKNARLIKPGVADIIFVNMEDALAAVKTYHMRLLDGKCSFLLQCSYFRSRYYIISYFIISFDIYNI